MNNTILKKRLSYFLFFALLPCLSFAQNWKYGNGFKQTPFYKKPGSITIHVNNFMFSGRKVATPPVNLNIAVTPFKNVTLGPVVTYFQFKQSEFEAINATRWINPEISYHEMMAGFRAEYHLNDLLQTMMRRRIPQHIIDVYAAGWGGYSFVWVNHSNAEQDLVTANEKFRGGASIGARSLVLKWLGFSLEGGYSSYGYCSFGLFFVAH